MKSHRSRSESRAESRSHRSQHHSQTTPTSHTISSPSSPPLEPSPAIPNNPDQSHTTDDVTITSGNFDDDDNDNGEEEDEIDGELRHDVQLEKDIDIMSKLKD